MNFRSGLSIALALSIAAAVWSRLPDEAVAPQAMPQPGPTRMTLTAADIARTPAPRSDNDLFPYQGPPATTSGLQATRRSTAVKPEATTSSPPPLPFQVSGAWWQGKQRFLLLTDNRRNWLICQQCRIAGAIRRGEKLNESWQLREITPDHLVLRWLPRENDQRLALDEMQSEPGF